MLAVEIEIPDTNRLASAPAAVGGCIGRTPLTDTPLLGGRDNTEILLDNPLIELCHFLMLCLSNRIYVGLFLVRVSTTNNIAHIHLADADQLARISQ